MRIHHRTHLITMITLLCSALVAVAACTPADEVPGPGSGQVVEATIERIHAAMQAGELTSRQLVEAYLARIDAYDKQGPALNAIVTLNPAALERADELDAALASEGLVGPLHGIPMIVKDNYDTADMQTSAGSAALAGSLPPDDAFQVQRIRQAGAIVLAKSHMAEWAFSPYQTVGSIIPGYTRNPYALNRVPAGSSGGHRGGGGGELRRGGARNRYRQLDSWTLVAQPAGGDPLDHGPDQPRWHRATGSRP